MSLSVETAPQAAPEGRTATALHRVPVEHIQAVVGAVVPLLEPALGREADLRMTDLFREILASRAHLWVVIRAEQVIGAVVSKLAERPLRKVGQVLYVGGRNMQEWIVHLDEIEAWAMQQGATRFQVLGRKGLKSVLKPRGYRESHVLLTKELA